MKGYTINKNQLGSGKFMVENIVRAIVGNDGYCPCKPNEKGNSAYKCPCDSFTSGNGCCCNLFVVDNSEEVE